jgi:hypothetical protein
MKTVLDCACLAIIAASLTGIPARAQMQPAPTVKGAIQPSTPVLRPSVVQPPFVVNFSIPPGTVGSFPAISVSEASIPAQKPRPGLPKPKPKPVTIERSPDTYSARFNQILNNTPANSSMTITAFVGGKARMQYSYSNIHLTSIKRSLAAPNQPRETLTFEYQEVKWVALP